MNTSATALICAAAFLATSSAFAADDMKKGEAMSKGGKTHDSMTMQQCKDHMAMAKPDGMKKDDAMMKKDAACADMMKKDGMMKSGGSAMQPGGMASGAMKK